MLRKLKNFYHYSIVDYMYFCIKNPYFIVSIRKHTYIFFSIIRNWIEDTDCFCFLAKLVFCFLLYLCLRTISTTNLCESPCIYFQDIWNFLVIKTLFLIKFKFEKNSTIIEWSEINNTRTKNKFEYKYEYYKSKKHDLSNY